LQASDWNKISILTTSSRHGFNSYPVHLGLEQPTYISASKPRYLKLAAIDWLPDFSALLFSLCSVIGIATASKS
jgi:hypothetical protein